MLAGSMQGLRPPPGFPGPGTWVEEIVDTRRQRRGDLRPRCQIRHGGRTDAPGRAQAPEQTRPERWSDSGDPVELGADRPSLAQLLVIRDGEPMRLVPDLLQRLERGRPEVQQERRAARRHVDLLRPPRPARDTDAIEPEGLEHLASHAELTAAPA